MSHTCASAVDDVRCGEADLNHRGFSDPVAFWCLVTQLDTQALRRSGAHGSNLLIGLVAEEGLEPPTRGL